MAVTLTAAENHLVYEVLGIPDALSVLNVNGDFGTGSRFENFAVTTAKTSIDAILLALADPLKTRLKELLVEWKKVATTGVKLKPVGSNEGVDRDPKRERGLIRRRIRSIVPVFLEDPMQGGGIPLG